MESSAESPSDAREFAEDLRHLEAKIQGETHAFDDMPADGKRKCIDDLEHTIQTLRKIKNNLKEAEDSSPDKNLVQILWKGHDDCTFTVSDFERTFEELHRRTRTDCPVPSIQSVIMQDNFSLDGNKMLQPTRMCFIKFSTKEDACMALGLQEMTVSMKMKGRSGGFFGLHVKFIQPTHSLDTHKTLRIIGNSIARLDKIDKELKKIGAVRGQGGMHELGPEFIDKAWYITKLQECKRLRACGVSLGMHSYAVLASKKPVDHRAVTQLIKQLSDEESDILIQLRDYQINGVDFEFKHPAC